MSQRIHDPTETGLPEYSTTKAIQQVYEQLHSWLFSIFQSADKGYSPISRMVQHAVL